MKLEKFEVGYNIPAKVGMNIKDVQTPSLIIDYKIFENNILKMKEFKFLGNIENERCDELANTAQERELLTDEGYSK